MSKLDTHNRLQDEFILYTDWTLGQLQKRVGEEIERRKSIIKVGDKVQVDVPAEKGWTSGIKFVGTVVRVSENAVDSERLWIYNAHYNTVQPIKKDYLTKVVEDF